jgi:hypothetical protein
MMFRVRLERIATKYLCGFRRSKHSADFERFLRGRAVNVLAYTELRVCPFCLKYFRGHQGLYNHLNGGRECGRKFRELINQLVEEYLAQRKSKKC